MALLTAPPGLLHAGSGPMNGISHPLLCQWVNLIAYSTLICWHPYQFYPVMFCHCQVL